MMRMGLFDGPFFPPPPPLLPNWDEYKQTSIADLRPFLKNINCKFMVLRKVDDPKTTKDGGTIYSFQVGDESGIVIANFWNEIGSCVQRGDILLMIGGFVTMFKNTIRIACKLGALVRLGRFCMSFNDKVDVSKPLWLPNPENDRQLVKQVEEGEEKIIVSSPSDNRP